MALTIDDLLNLRNGRAPTQLDLIKDMTLGSEIWLDRFIPYYLDDFIPAGGSKVKVLIGDSGSGKSHLLRYIQGASLERRYTAVFRSARTDGPKLSDLPNLYRLISASIDMDEMVRGLSLRVAESLSYRPPIYDGQTKLVPYIVAEGYGSADAAREVRIAIARLLKDADLSPACFTFAVTLLKDRLISEDPEAVKTALRWFRGEKLELAERRESALFERLEKTTARRWLDSLLKLLVLSGQNGLLLILDDLDVLYERSEESGRFLYTPNNIKDSCELFRQLIDDADLLKHMLVLLAGRRSVLDDEKRGFKSYEALWMRLQTGLVPSGQFNSLCDIVDVDQHLLALGSDFPAKLSAHLGPVFSRYGLKRKLRDAILPGTNPLPSLKDVVIEHTFANEDEGGNEYAPS